MTAEEVLNDYKGKCYCVMKEDDEGLMSDITSIVAEYCHGGKYIGGFISERDAREAMAYYVTSEMSRSKAKSVSADAVINGRALGMHVYVRDMKTIAPPDDDILLYVKPSSSLVGESVYANVSECMGLSAIPFFAFSNSLRPIVIEKEDDMDVLDDINEEEQG